MKSSKTNSSANSNGGHNNNSGNNNTTSSSGGSKNRLNHIKGEHTKNNQADRLNNTTSKSANTGNNNIRKETSSQNSNQKSSDSIICNICAQNVPGPEREKIFAFSKCDHFVCYVCSARLRVICDQYECPICREKLEDVVFRKDKDITFEKCNLTNYIYDEKHKIYFEDESLRRAFENLLVYRCLECLRDAAADNDEQDIEKGNGSTSAKKDTAASGQNTSSQHKSSRKLLNRESAEFNNVIGLKHHLDRTHRLKLCELCLTHNKLFPFEYSYYTGSSLRDHMKFGEPNTSHKGHPNCSLCHETFFNLDELLQHMSREHYHCHLCGRHDSNMRIYFLDYESLRQHFKSRHHLCERGNCRHEQFTSAFDSQIDYQLHLVHVHGGQSAGLSRGEARQQRTITLDSTSHREPLPSRSNIPPNAAVISTGLIATANSSRRDRAQLPESIRAQLQQQQQQRRLPTRAEFPALGLETSTSTSASPQQVNVNPTSSQNFPALPTPSVSTPRASSHRVIAGPSSARSFVRSVGGGYRAPTQLDELDFPPLPEQPKNKSKNKKAKPQQQTHPRDTGPLTLEQLISNSLSLSSQSSSNNKKNGTKGGKNVKAKAIKIQL